MDHERWPDEGLAERFQAGDYAAFETLVQRYSGPIYQFALRLVGNQPDAEDAVQQTFIQTFESLPRKRADVPVRSWLFQVAHNKCIDLLRRRRTIPASVLSSVDADGSEIEGVDPNPLPDEIFEHTELQQLLQSAIMELPLRSRQVVLLRYLGDLTFGEIGKALSMPENTAKTIFQRAKVRLKRDLQARL